MSIISAVKDLPRRYPIETKVIAVVTTALVVALAILATYALVRIVVLDQQLGYGDLSIGFRKVPGEVINEKDNKPVQVTSQGTLTDYQVASGIIIRVLEGFTGTRAYVQLDHLLPPDAKVLSFSVACETNSGNWHTFLPITEEGTSPKIDDDVNPVSYRAGWGPQFAYAQFPITSASDYGQRRVRLTLIFKVLK